MITSAVILVGLSFVLSPYILVAGASVLLIGGYKILPSQFRFLIPGPVIEASCFTPPPLPRAPPGAPFSVKMLYIVILSCCC